MELADGGLVEEVCFSQYFLFIFVLGSKYNATKAYGSAKVNLYLLLTYILDVARCYLRVLAGLSLRTR
jgi:hypothetical protein